MKKYKQYLLPVLVVVFFVLGLFVVSLSVKQRQTLRNKAANTSGIGSVSLVPLTATHNIGDLFPVTLKFNTGGASISSIALRLIYRFTGATPELDATSITADNALLSTGDWTFPVKTITKSNGMVTIDFSGVNTNTAGYSSTTDTNLATINFRVNSLPSINPVILSFDATQSKMITKSGFKDILGQPNSGSYTIVSPTPTPFPTSTPGPVISGLHWQTSTVKLDADSFYIQAGNQIFTGTPDPGTYGMNVHSDPGTSAYTTLESNWIEHGVEMRLYIYFRADTNNWWSYDLATYNGLPYPNSDWIDYAGTRFLTPLGQTYTNPNLNLQSTNGVVGGTVHFTNLNLRVTPNTNTPFPTSTPTPEVLNLHINLQGVNSISNNTPDTKTFTVTTGMPNTDSVVQYTVNLTQDQTGAYVGTIPDLGVNPGTTLVIFAKDATHLRKNISSGGASGQTIWPGTNYAQGLLLAGDFNNDNNINILDFGKFLSVYTSLSVSVTNGNRIYDANRDGVINIKDIALMLTNYLNLENPGD